MMNNPKKMVKNIDIVNPLLDPEMTYPPCQVQNKLQLRVSNSLDKTFCVTDCGIDFSILCPWFLMIFNFFHLFLFIFLYFSLFFSSLFHTIFLLSNLIFIY